MNQLRRMSTWLLGLSDVSFLFFALLASCLVRLVYLYSGDSFVHGESFDYLVRSKIWGGVDGTNVYLGVPAFGGGWRIPSFLYFNFNHLAIKTIGYNGLVTLISLANALSLGLAYTALARLFPERLLIARLTLVVAIVTPYSIFFSMGIWNPIFIFPLSALAFWFYVRWKAGREAWSLVFSSLSLCVLAQYHLIAYFFIPALVVTYFIDRPPLKPLTLIAAVLPWLLLAGGYFYFDSTFDFANTKQIFTRGSGDKVGAFYHNLSFLGSFVGSGSNDLSMGLKPQMKDFYSQFLGYSGIGFFMNGLHFLFIAVAAVFFIIVIIRSIRRNGFRAHWKNHSGSLAILLWVFLHVVLFFLLGKSYNTRYAIVIFPFVITMQCAFWLELEAWDNVWTRLARWFFVFNLFFMAYIVVALDFYSYRRVTLAGLPTNGLMNDLQESILKDAIRDGRYPLFYVEKSFDGQSVQNGSDYFERWSSPNAQAYISRRMKGVSVNATNEYTTLYLGTKDEGEPNLKGFEKILKHRRVLVLKKKV